LELPRATRLTFAVGANNEKNLGAPKNWGENLGTSEKRGKFLHALKKWKNPLGALKVEKKSTQNRVEEGIVPLIKPLTV